MRDTCHFLTWISTAPTHSPFQQLTVRAVTTPVADVFSVTSRRPTQRLPRITQILTGTARTARNMGTGAQKTIFAQVAPRTFAIHTSGLCAEAPITRLLVNNARAIDRDLLARTSTQATTAVTGLNLLARRPRKRVRGDLGVPRKRYLPWGWGGLAALVWAETVPSSFQARGVCTDTGGDTFGATGATTALEAGELYQ